MFSPFETEREEKGEEEDGKKVEETAEEAEGTEKH